MYAMDSLIRSCIWAALITGILGRSLLSQIVYSNSTNDFVDGESKGNECDRRYYQHYEIKGCQVNQVDSYGCPTSYLCPSTANVSFAETKVCVYQNAEYQVGDKIELNDRCQVCRCVGEVSPRVVCRHRECPQVEAAEGQNCHLVYEDNKCCPSRYECVSYSDANSIETIEFTCAYQGVHYPLGSKIYPSDDPCLICDCSKDWDGVDNSSCHQQECVIEKKRHLLDIGCVPVYHENKCCPVEYYCPDASERTYHFLEKRILPDEDISENNNTSDVNNVSQCYFDGKAYDVGIEIPMNNSCIKCNCQVPPDFTCIHQSCPKMPNTENCVANYIDNQCCPIYSCIQGDESMGRNLTDESGEAICPTPLCADKSCVIGVLPDHECPTCICDESREKNDFEPILQEVEPHYVEADNGTLDNEILSPLTPKNFSEREPLSQVFKEAPFQKHTIEHEGMEDTESVPEHDLGNPLSEVSADFEGESESESTPVEGQPAEEQPAEEEPAEEQPAGEQPAEEQPAGEEPSEEQPAEEQPAEEQPAEEQPAGEQPAEEQPDEEQPAEEQPAEEQPAGEQPDEEQPADFESESESEGTPAEEQGNSTEVVGEYRQKRSENLQSDANSQQQWNVLQQDQSMEEPEDLNANSERELEGGNSENFGEIKVFSTKTKQAQPALSDLVELDDNELGNVIWTMEVAGCPAPMCADSTCRIGIPPGHSCPTCVCKKRRNRQP